MERKIKRGVWIYLLAGFIFGLFILPAIAGAQGIPRKIVVFQENFVNEAAQNTLLKNFGATIIKSLRLINGTAVYLPPQAERALLGRPGILRIDDDLVINATGQFFPVPVGVSQKPSGKPTPSIPPQPNQALPWGVDRIEADIAQSTTKGLAIRVAILDTGIDLDHLDLQNNIKGNVNTINPRKSGDDDNGHGTHVAGIVAAVDNTIGVIGVGPEVYLYAVKVLDKNGSGWLSDLIEGLDWCINNKMQIINMSLGSPSDNQSFHDAITRAYRAGITQVAAAGNNGLTGGSVDYPGRYPETIAVSAVGQYAGGALYFAPFSSYGPEVDLAAPGVSVNSCWKDGYYKTLNGTSMATPHVSGAATLVLTTAVGAYDLNGNGLWDPEEVKHKLQTTAENLGLDSNEQGAGLVRADLAIQ